MTENIMYTCTQLDARHFQMLLRIAKLSRPLRSSWTHAAARHVGGSIRAPSNQRPGISYVDRSLSRIGNWKSVSFFRVSSVFHPCFVVGASFHLPPYVSRTCDVYVRRVAMQLFADQI